MTQMTMVTLGADVAPLELKMAKDSDFISILGVKNGTWANRGLEIRFASGEVWAATISPDLSTATFDVDGSVVTALLNTKTRKARLYITQASGDVCIATGHVVAK